MVDLDLDQACRCRVAVAVVDRDLELRAAMGYQVVEVDRLGGMMLELGRRKCRMKSW